MPARPTSPAGVGRRTMLRSGTLLLAAGLAGCGVRLEEDAPDLPFIPRRVRVRGEDLLLDLLTSTLALAGTATANGSALGLALDPVHRQQAAVVQDALLRGGVPPALVTEAITTVPAPAAGVSDADLASAEGHATLERERYAVLAPELARPVLALVAQRLAAVTLLTPGAGQHASSGPAPTASSPSPTSSPSAATPGAAASPSASPSSSTAPSPSGLGPALTAVLEAIHAFEVIQARSPQDGGSQGVRERASATTTWLRVLAETWTLQLGSNAPEVPIAIRLPFPVTTPEEATKLGAEMLVRVRATLGRHLATLEGPDLTAAWSVLPTTLADVEVHAHAWGAPLEAFPGLP